MYFEQNLKKLETLSPRLAKRLRGAESVGSVSVVTSKAGPPSIKVGDVLLHSVYDPVREARDWVEHHRSYIEASSSIAVLGFGFGYHIEELLRVTDKPVVAFDPRIDVLLAAALARDLSELLSLISIACCLDDLEAPSADGMLGILRHEPSVRLDPAAHEQAASRLEPLREHTYERRMEEMIGFMIRSGFGPRRQRWGERSCEELRRDDPGMLIAEAGADTELGKYLSRFAGARSLKLSDIVQDIQEKGEDLSRVERIFLAMEAFRKR